MSKRYDWTEEQIEDLKRLYPNNCLCDVADTLGIGVDVVRRKAIALGLKKAEGFSHYHNYGRYVKKGNHFNV